MVRLRERQCGSIRTRTQEEKVALVILNSICGLVSHAPSRTGVISNRPAISVEELVNTPMRCIHRMLLFRATIRILQEPGHCVFGRLPHFWMYTLSMQHTVRMHTFHTSELLNLCTMM